MTRGTNYTTVSHANKTRLQVSILSRPTAKNGELKLAKCDKPLDIRWSQPLPSDPTTVTVSKDHAGRHFVSCLCEFEPTLLPVTDKKVGIDVGIKDLFVTSDGFKSGNPRYTAKYAAKLAKVES